MRLNKLLSAALLTLVAALPLSADPISNLAQSLIELRADVETLHQQLDDVKEQYSVRMKSFNGQRTEMEASISREDLKIKQLTSSLKKIQKRIALHSSGSSALKAIALKGIAQLKMELADQLPFKMTERQTQLDDIAKRISNNQMTPEKGLNRVWAIYEDNFRMSHENGIFRQNVTIDSKEYLADVVRLGSLMMYFKTSDGKMGYFAKSAKAWKIIETSDSDEKEYIASLFDSMKKQIRSGFFVLPNALSEAK